MQFIINIPRLQLWSKVLITTTMLLKRVQLALNVFPVPAFAHDFNNITYQWTS